MQLSIWNWLLAFSPVIVILVLMLGFRWGGSKAGAFSWFVTLLLAVFRFGAGAQLVGYSQAKAILLSIDVLYIIWMALLLFHTAKEAGAVQIISSSLVSITSDRTFQGLLLGWLFVSFLQGMGGFGVPVAVTAPLLVGVGFTPIQAVIMASVGHGWAVNFGSMATSFQTLMAITGLPGEYLAAEPAILLGLSSIICGMIVAFIAGGWKGLGRTFSFIAIISAIMGVVQYLLVTGGIWTLGATGGAMSGLVVAIGLLRLNIFQRNNSAETADQKMDDIPSGIEAHLEKRSLVIALSAYLVLVVLAFAFNLITPLKEYMNSLRLTLQFPALQTSLGWVTPAETGRRIRIFGHPGAILFYSSLIGYVIYRATGFIDPGAPRRIIERVSRGAVKSSLGIIAMVGLAVLMSHSGMTNLLAQGMSQSFGEKFYPFVAPFIGTLGAFITGSNNNANVIFGLLQQNTAEMLGLSVPLILGAQTAGASLGSIIAPAKVIVGCSTVGLGNKEGMVMGRIMGYGLIPVVFVAIVTIILRMF
jgi:lactate permease